jgi:hypothetical protein
MADAFAFRSLGASAADVFCAQQLGREVESLAVQHRILALFFRHMPDLRALSNQYDCRRSQMKTLLGAALAAVLLATPALAQTETTAPAAPVPASSCGALPAQPTMPDGAVANREEMEAANTAFVAWFEQYRANLTCRSTEATALRAQFEARFAEHNTGVEALEAANTSWTAEAAEFNARTDRRRLR